MDSFTFLRCVFLCFNCFIAFSAGYFVIFAPVSCCFISSILVLALNMVDACNLLSLFIYVCLMPGFHVVLFIRYCVLFCPSAFVFIMFAFVIV